MNKNAKKWVEALESGEYTQCQGQLKSVDSFCCLGVGCELYRQEHPECEWNYSNFKIPGENGGEYCGSLPLIVQKWLGLDNEWASYNESGVVTNLVHQNDINEKSFKEIAQIIKSEPKGLFNDVVE